jgi:hypothetical protein
MITKSTAILLIVSAIGILSVARLGNFTYNTQMTNDSMNQSKDTELIQEATRTVQAIKLGKLPSSVIRQDEEQKPNEKQFHKHYNIHLNSNDDNYQEMVDALGIREYLPDDDGKPHHEKINMHYKLRVTPIAR